MLTFKINARRNQPRERGIIAGDDLNNHGRDQSHIHRNRDINLIPAKTEIKHKGPKYDHHNQQGCRRKIYQTEDTANYRDRDEIGNVPLLIGITIAKHGNCPGGKQHRNHHRHHPDTAQMSDTDIDITDVDPGPLPCITTHNTACTKNKNRIDRQPIGGCSVMGIGKGNRVGQQQAIKNRDLP